MASDAKSALEVWERSVEQVKLATNATQAALKLMEAASTKVIHDAWDTVCSARAALSSAVGDEREKFAVIEAQKAQTTMDFEGRARENKGGAVAGSGTLHPQEPLKLMPAPGSPATEEEEAFEDPDRLVDEDDEEGKGEPDAGEKSDDGEPADEEEGDGAPKEED